MTTVLIEQATLSGGSILVYRDYGDHIRMAYDPDQTNEAHALDVLHTQIPRLQPLVHAHA